MVRTRDEETRRDAVMAAVAVLVRRYDEHKRVGWTENGRSSIAIGALDELVAAYRGEVQS